MINEAILVENNQLKQKEYICFLYINKKLSIAQIATQLNKAPSTIRLILLKEELLRTRTEGIRIASKDGRTCMIKGKKRIFTEEWKENISIARNSWSNVNAKGRTLKPSGYIELTRGVYKYKSEHKLIMETKLGRKLRKEEVVHHIDGNKTNNSLDNLQLMTRSEHSSHHAKENYKSRKINNKGQFKGQYDDK